MAKQGFVVAFLDALGVDRATLLGHSMGGGVALRVAIDFPERVDRLVLVSPLGFRGRVCWQFRIMRWPVLGELLSRPSRRSARSLGRLCVSDPALVTPEIVETSYAMSRRPGGRRYTLATTRGLFAPDTAMLDDLPRIEAPTLIVWGAQDRVLPLDWARQPWKLLPRGRLHVFDSCGHMAMFERPDELNALAARVSRRRAEVRRDPCRRDGRGGSSSASVRRVARVGARLVSVIEQAGSARAPAPPWRRRARRGTRGSALARRRA
jgi:4,5:9,10-diseco-3-hydroxy-5,9,17-trioxoandrosta-1(10),2-diene-4-oate hydrolase